VIHLDASGIVLLAAASVLAAAINGVAGGGSFLSFPALLALGYPALSANVTNTVGLLTGYVGNSLGYRDELRGQAPRITVLGVVGALGAAAGAVLLIITSPALFRGIIPWVVLASSAMLGLQPLLGGWISRSRVTPGDHRSPLLIAGLFGGGLYGAFFGAGLGVMLLAVLGSFIDDTLQRINALKALLSLLINAVAALYFVFLGAVVWGAVAVMVPAALAGGFAGTALSRRLDVGVLRVAMVAFGIAVGVRLLV